MQRIAMEKMSGERNRRLTPRWLGSRKQDGRVLGIGFHSIYIKVSGLGLNILLLGLFRPAFSGLAGIGDGDLENAPIPATPNGAGF